MLSPNSANRVFRLMLFAASILMGANFVWATGGAPRVKPEGPTAQTQVRDHLTEKEDELVREFQEIDKRIEIYVKAADRRLLVLINPNTTQKKKEE